MLRITEIMTPEKACLLLAGQQTDSRRVDRIKEKMLSGTWVTDDGYFINVRKGKVINGKHRLKAIIELGINKEMRIQYD